jgi:hypothetical protein
MRYDLFVDMSSESLRLRTNLDEEIVGTVSLIDVKSGDTTLNKLLPEATTVEELINEIIDIKEYTKEHLEVYKLDVYKTPVKGYFINFDNSNQYDNKLLTFPDLFDTSGKKPGTITLNRPLKPLPSTPINNKYRYIIDWTSSDAIGPATVNLTPDIQPISVGQNVGYKGFTIYDLLPSTTYYLEIITYNSSKSLKGYDIINSPINTTL